MEQPRALSRGVSDGTLDGKSDVGSSHYTSASSNSAGAWSIEFSSTTSRLKRMRRYLFNLSYYSNHGRSQTFYRLSFLFQLGMLCLFPIFSILVDPTNSYRVPGGVNHFRSIDTLGLSTTNALISQLSLSGLGFTVIALLIFTAIRVTQGHSLGRPLRWAAYWLLPLTVSVIPVPIFFYLAHTVLYKIALFGDTWGIQDGLTLFWAVPVSCLFISVAFALVTCNFHPSVVRPTVVSSIHSTTITAVMVAELACAILKQAPDALSRTWTISVPVMDALCMVICLAATIFIIVDQQYIRSLPTAVMATVMAHACGIFFMSTIGSAMYIAPSIMGAVAFILAFWPIPASLLLKRFTANPSTETLPRFIPSFVLDVLLRRHIHAVTAAKDATTAPLKHLPVALPGFSGLDQFGPPPHELVAPEDQGPTDRLFALFQHVLAHHRRSMRLHLTFGLAMLTVRPASIEYGLQLLATSAKISRTGLALDLNYSVFSIYKSRIAAMATGTNGAERHERHAKLVAVKKMRAELIQKRRQLWTAIADGRDHLTTARLGKLLGLLAEDGRLSDSLERGFRGLLSQAWPSALREYACYLDDCLGLDAKADEYLAIADDIETVGRSSTGRPVAPISSSRRTGFLWRSRAELRCLIGIVLAGLVMMAVLGLISLLIITFLPRFQYQFQLMAMVRLTVFTDRVGALMYAKLGDPSFLLAQAPFPLAAMPALLMTAGKTQVLEAIGIFEAGIPLMAGAITNNTALLEFFALEASMEYSTASTAPFSLDTAMHTISTAFSPHHDTMSTSSVTIQAGPNSMEAFFINVLQSFFSMQVGMAVDNVATITAAGAGPAFDGIIPSASYAFELSFLALAADVMEKELHALFDSMFIVATTTPLQVIIIAAIGFGVFGAMLALVMACFFVIPVIQDTRSLLTQLKIALDFPAELLADLSGRAHTSPDPTTEITDSVVLRNSDTETDDMTDARTLHRQVSARSIAVAKDGDPPQAPTGGQGFAGCRDGLRGARCRATAAARWRATDIRITLAKLARVVPISAGWWLVVACSMASVLITVTYMLFMMQRTTEDIAMVYNTMIAAMQASARAAEISLEVYETGETPNMHLVTQMMESVEHLKEGQAWLLSSSDTIEDEWNPELTGIYGTLEWLAHATTADTWTSGYKDADLIALLQSKACAIQDWAPELCPENVATDSINGGLNVAIQTMLTALINMVTIDPTTAKPVLLETMETALHTVTRGVVPYMMKLTAVLRDRQDTYISIGGLLALMSIMDMITILVAMHVFLFRRQTADSMRQKARLRAMLEAAYHAKKEGMPSDTRHALRKIINESVVDEMEGWADE